MTHNFDELHDRAKALCESALSLEDVLTGLWQLLGEFMDAPIVILIGKDRDGVTVLLYDRSGELLMPDNPLLPEGTVSGQVLQSGKSRLFVADEDWPERAIFTFGGLGQITQSAMFVPLVSGGATTAVLSVQSFAPGAYTRKNLEQVERCAPFIAARIAKELRAGRPA